MLTIASVWSRRGGFLGGANAVDHSDVGQAGAGARVQLVHSSPPGTQSVRSRTLEPDRLFTNVVADAVRMLGLSAIEVDGDLDVEALTARVAHCLRVA